MELTYQPVMPTNVTPRWSLLVPVLPATVCPLILAAVAVPLETTSFIMSTAIQAVEAVDACVGRAVEAIEKADGAMFICADHGNVEQLVDYETGEPFTAHTTNPVPFILVNAGAEYGLREGGCLADIAPTLIELMGMEQPKEMTGKSLLVKR